MITMREPTVYLLAALAEGRQHGYALIGVIERLSGGRVSLRPATLYGALERLTGQGLVRVAGEEAVDGRLRRYFELTDAGAAALADQQDRLAQAARAAAHGLKVRGADAGAGAGGGGAPVAAAGSARCRHDTRTHGDRRGPGRHRDRPTLSPLDAGPVAGSPQP
jgi:PadR family transcriptional regulator, regulatory protein PadR